MKAQAKKPSKPGSMLDKLSRSFSTRTVLLFGLVSVMTALLLVGFLSVVWNLYFNKYTAGNMQVKANSITAALTSDHIDNGDWDFDIEEVVDPYMDGSIDICVYDIDGNLLYTNTESSVPVEGNVAVPIVENQDRIGTLRLWVEGSENLMTQRDIEFQNTSLGVILFAAIIAVILSLIVGITFTRTLVNPVRKISKTATAIKNGNLSARTNLVGNDEIAVLGQTIDDMADAIKNDRELERRLTSDVAHELRTPLMAMQATVEAMIDGVLPCDDQHLAMVDNEVNRLSNLVDAMLKLSRLENRSTPINLTQLDLGELLEELAYSHQMFIEEQGLIFNYVADPGVVVMGDPDLIKQATANLLSNAIRYTPAGGQVSIEVRKGSLMGQIHVKDTGIGLSREDQKHIFSRFWRADAGRNRSSGGLGIGLAIVKEIVDRHNGWINVESTENVGSEFTIYIPLVDESEIDVKSKKRQEKKRSKAIVDSVDSNENAAPVNPFEDEAAKRRWNVRLSIPLPKKEIGPDSKPAELEYPELDVDDIVELLNADDSE